MSHPIRTDLPPAQQALLERVASTGTNGTTADALALEVNLSKPVLTRTLNRLREAGLVEGDPILTVTEAAFAEVDADGPQDRGEIDSPAEVAAETEPIQRAAKPASGPRQPREGSAMHAALTVLKGKRAPMSPQEIYDEAVKRGLADGLKGKTPVATLAAQLATANKAGRFVERPKPGHYQLRRPRP